MPDPKPAVPEALRSHPSPKRRSTKARRQQSGRCRSFGLPLRWRCQASNSTDSKSRRARVEGSSPSASASATVCQCRCCCRPGGGARRATADDRSLTNAITAPRTAGDRSRREATMRGGRSPRSLFARSSHHGDEGAAFVVAACGHRRSRSRRPLMPARAAMQVSTPVWPATCSSPQARTLRIGTDRADDSRSGAN